MENSFRELKLKHRTEMLQGFNNLIRLSYAYKYPLVIGEITNGVPEPFIDRIHNLLPDDVGFRKILASKKRISDKKEEIRKQFIDIKLTEEDKKHIAEAIGLPFTYNDKKYGIYNQLIDFEMLMLLFFEFTGTERSEFNRAYDRILTSKAFGRLQYKTQVMVNSSSDEQRTRLSHSLEVQKIAKIIAMQFGANWELAETISIGHDIGHAPFGHVGEEALNDCLERCFCGNFSHALQSVKVLNNLETHPIMKKYGMDGMCISKRVLRGILQHDSDCFSENDNITNAGYRMQYDCSDIIDNAGKLPVGGVESQIVYWADKIAYCAHDWEEFVHCDFLSNMLARVDKLIFKIHDANRRSIDDQNKSNSECNSEEDFVGNLERCINKLSMGLREEEKENVKQERPKLIKELVSLEKNVFDEKDNPKFKLHMISKYEYRYFFDFFRIALAWIDLTGIIPSSTSNNITFVLYNYFQHEINGRTIKRCLQDKVMEHTFDKIKELSEYGYTESEFLELTNIEVGSIDSSDRKKFKKEFKEKLFVSIAPRHLNAWETINKYIKTHYIRSTTVRNMRDKANLITRTLFDYYMEHREMLPYEYRIRLSKKRNQREDDAEWKNREKWIKQFVVERLKDAYGFNNKNLQKLCAYNQQDDDKEEKYTTVCSEFYKNIEWDDLSLLLYGIRLGSEDKNKRNLRDVLEKMKNDDGKPRYNNNDINDLLIKFNELRFLVKEKDYRGRNKLVLEAISARVVADYIASITDRMAEKKYDEIVSSKTNWSTTYDG